MIWYLLYPLRGTTEPPALSATHPLRRAFTQYGRTAARHPVITLLTSVALSAILIYPFPFLYTNNFTNGTSNLPHHVWTAALPFDGPATTRPDVVMRSLWVHGSYMKAIERDVLAAALDLQDALLGSTINFDPTGFRKSDHGLSETTSQLSLNQRDAFHASNGLSEESWFFHSPLIYWSNSKASIDADEDIINTVNRGSQYSTKVNVTLRHSVVFSGKRFEDNKLVAADALVITLIHKVNSPVGRNWERKAEDLAFNEDSRWKLYPKSGRVATSNLYEFKFQPLSFQDDFLLGCAYSLTLLYFILSLTKLRALKSRVGLTITVITQIAVSIMSSFTICAILKIDLSKIPREAYPVVVLTIGLENMFRLVNAVITTPVENSMPARIAEALGKTSYIALAGVAQNLSILWLLYKVVSPGVGAFCIFAALALVFDFLFLMTFFVAVLSVDVRRTELSDSLNRASRQKSKPVNRTPKVSWVDAMLCGEVPVSTRVAGTAVMVTFVLIAQWHFFDQEHPLQTFRRALNMFQQQAEPLPARPFENINQARTPTAWLKLQDHETAREVIQVVKPDANSYIARVYEPLIVVLAGSNRTKTAQGIRPFLPAAYDFAKHQSWPFFVSVLFAVAAVSLLMNYLLWDEDHHAYDPEERRPEDDPLLRSKSLEGGHMLDIIMMASSPNGMAVSLGTDRRICVWDVKHNRSHQVDILGGHPGLYPVLAMAVDDQGMWLALASGDGTISLWNMEERRWGLTVTLTGTKGRAPVAFFFKLDQTGSACSIIFVHSSGLLNEVDIKEPSVGIEQMQICKSPLVGVQHFFDRSSNQPSPPAINMVTASRRGCVHMVTQVTNGWLSEGVDAIWPKGNEGVKFVFPLPALRCMLAVRIDAVDLVNLDDQVLLHTFSVPEMKPTSLRCFHSVPKRVMSAAAISSLTLVYTNEITGACEIRTYRAPKHFGDLIRIGARGNFEDASSCSWQQAMVETENISEPGEWEILPIGAVIGIRTSNATHPSSRNGLQAKTTSPPPTLRRRTTPPIKTHQAVYGEDSWEAWVVSPKGENLDISLADDTNTVRPGQQLLATACGPICRIGQSSIAVGLGNVVKIVTMGHERYEGELENLDGLAAAIAGRRRKQPSSKRGCGHRTHV